MAVESISTFDQDPPHRPAPAEIGSGAKENRPPPYGPDPITMPTAEEFNHKRNLLGKLGAEMALARFLLTFPGGAPTLTLMFAANDAMLASDFAITDNGAGDTTVAWTTGPGGKLPPTTGGPTISQADDTEIDRKRAFYTTAGGNPAVRAKTKLGATGTDAAVVVTIY